MSMRRDSFHRFVSGSAVTVLSLLLLILADPGRATAQGRKTSDPATASTESTESPGLSLNYTGALFGYYRIEPDETNPAYQLHPPDEFRKHGYQNPLLLGMGDNFSPEFGASVERELKDGDPCYLKANKPWPGHKNVAPEVLYKNEDRLPTMAECDNVGRFLMKAGFRAIVPGKEDFLYSARWLRRMAHLFHGASDIVTKPNPFSGEGQEPVFNTSTVKIPSPGNKLLMLAANLRLNFKLEGKEKDTVIPPGMETPKPSKSVKGKTAPGLTSYTICPLLFSWDPLGADLETCISGGDRGDTVTTETDWLRRLDLTVDPIPGCRQSTSDQDECVPVAASINAQARKDVKFRRQLLENEAKIILATLDEEKKWGDLKHALGVLGQDKAFEALNSESAPLKLSKNGQESSASLRAIASQEAPPDLRGILEALCSELDQLSSASRQSNVDFLFPPDARRVAIHLLLTKIATKQKDIGYTIVGGSGPMAGTLVIGVIGQETMKAVSLVNLKLCTRWKADLTVDLPCEDGRDDKGSDSAKGKFVGTVAVGDPLSAVTTVLRAAWAKEGPFDKVVVMAQMPRTEAEELAAHAVASLRNTVCSDRDEPTGAGGLACPDRNPPDAPHIDLILSEAQLAHTTPEVELRYARKDMIPVIAPKPAWYINKEGRGLQDAVSTVTISRGEFGPGRDRLLNNHEPPYEIPGPTAQTMSELFQDELKQLAIQRSSADLSNLENFWNDCQPQKACQNSMVMQYLLEQIHRSSHADVVLLEYRDFYFGRMLGEYGNYQICKEWLVDHPQPVPGLANPEAYCSLRVALDRILWKGDYSERVMVDGKSLQQMLKTAQEETEDEQTLAARDTVDEWLMTFGIVTKPPQNLAAASMGPATFAIPGVSFCKDPGSDTGASEYCVNGQRVTDDGAYWVGTSDHLAEDNQVYKILRGLDDKYHMRKKKLFITGEIADEVFRHGREEASEKLVTAPVAQLGMSRIEELQQKRPILQVDSAKLVAGFMLRKPSMSNTQLASNFSGVTDSRATTPSAQELDLEALARATTGRGVERISQRLKAGIQSDFEYDRAVTGNLTGSAPTVTYALNSLTTGGFLQLRLRGDLAPRLFLVVAPFQYQTQIAGNYLNFNLATGSGQITVSAPRWEGFSQRVGARYEFGPRLTESYAEGGPEYSNINHVLSGLLLPNGMECPASATIPFAACVASKIVVTPSTVITPQTETLHTAGWYWNVHLQKALDKDKRTSLTFETKGDYYLWPGVTLPTQSRMAFTTSEAFNCKAIGNLVFSPTITQFFYSNQGPASHRLMTNTFAVTAKWYFARDAAVPFWRQFWFRGPASLDQTKSAKMQ
jgi:hypothetical protein